VDAFGGSRRAAAPRVQVTSSEEWDRFRQRWRDVRSDLHLASPADPAFGTGGLVRHAPEVRTRFVILPADPMLTVAEFDDEVWEWWQGAWGNPFEGGNATNWGQEQTPTVEAAVRFRRWRDGRWQWDDYVALHRNGCVEFGLGRGGSHDFT